MATRVADAGIWEACDGAKRMRRLSVHALRAVEAQHVVSTRKLVDSDAEQRLLEELIDSSKPRLLPELSRLHYLLSTPFRYAPLRHGSRFGSRAELGIWYGSETERTLFAEIAYYRLAFLEGTTARLDRLMVELSSFRVPLRTSKGIDLTKPPFAAQRARISSKTSYATSQRLGRAMRVSGVQVFRFSSARDPSAGPNLGVFQPRAFAATRPSNLQTWLAVATKQGVEISRKDFFHKQSYEYPREIFEVRGELPVPAF